MIKEENIRLPFQVKLHLKCTGEIREDSINYNNSTLAS
jgi:hypothetical protein